MLRQAVDSPVTPSGDDAPSPPDPSQTVRKRKAGCTTRGVATLTPDQLAKKRANDRDAQRAIRERTKTQIETLERRIQELTAQQPYQELQEVIRQKDAIQAENHELKRRLTSILHIIQPLVGAQGLTELASVAHGNLASSNQDEAQLHQAMNAVHSQHDVKSMSHQTSTMTSTHPFPQQLQGEVQGVKENKIWLDSMETLNNQIPNIHRSLESHESHNRLPFHSLLDDQSSKHKPTNAGFGISSSHQSSFRRDRSSMGGVAQTSATNMSI